MAPTVTLLDSEVLTSNGTTYSTNSVTLTAGRRYLLGIMPSNSAGGSTLTPSSITGVGSWTSLRDEYSGAVGLELFECIAASTETGTIDFEFANPGDNYEGFGWALLEFQGDDTGAALTNINSIVDPGVTSLSVSLPSAPDADSVVIGFFAVNANEVQDPNGSTELVDDENSSPPRSLQVLQETPGDGTLTGSSASSTTRRAIIVEVPAASDNELWVSHVELETPNAPRELHVSQVELETPNAPRELHVSQVELQTPDGPRVLQVSFVELETPNAPRVLQVSWVELETPDAPSLDRELQVSVVELEAPSAPRALHVSFIELETANAPRTLQVSHVELEVPNAPQALEVSWIELEVPEPPGRRLYVSHVEFETPNGARALWVSWVELWVSPGNGTEAIVQHRGSMGIPNTGRNRRPRFVTGPRGRTHL